MTDAMKTCPYCAEEVRGAATRCRYCGSWLGPRESPGEWYRDTQEQRLSGVCSGLARHFGVSATPIRIAFIIAAVFGWGVLIYLALWILMPVRQRAVATPPTAPAAPVVPPTAGAPPAAPTEVPPSGDESAVAGS